jgi:hypothetical protein
MAETNNTNNTDDSFVIDVIGSIKKTEFKKDFSKLAEIDKARYDF